MQFIESDFEKKASLRSANFIVVVILSVVFFMGLVVSVFRLQIFEHDKYDLLASSNPLTLIYEYPDRGVIYDRNGIKVAENITTNDLYIDLAQYLDVDGVLMVDQIKPVAQELEQILGDEWKSPTENEEYDSLYEFIVRFYQDSDDILATPDKVLVAQRLGNEQTIAIKRLMQNEESLILEEGSSRRYPYPLEMSHILGYTGLLTYEDLQNTDKSYLGYDEFVGANGYNDIVGKLGIERVYDEQLIGEKGVIAIERDAYADEIPESERVIQDTKDGTSLYLTIDIEAQRQMYEILVRNVERTGAQGGVGIIQDVSTGELLVMASAPGYDTNQFIGGIGFEEYARLTEDPYLPLLNRPIAAQLPPGSTFKTLTAAAALDAGALTPSTVYLSSSNYVFSNGASFQEYRNRAYGYLDLEDAISVSSNIYFCEVIRNWDIDELVSYYDAFGIGKPTGVDLYGEAAGRLPSPQNKIDLANTPGITWLDPIWYPEGDGCNTVIGQGITLVTPLQMANWTTVIANRGTLMQPHLLLKYEESPDAMVESAEGFEPLNDDFISSQALDTVAESMYLAVSGPRATIRALDGAAVPVAAKTGTAEFGALNADGVYENTHAWVTGFFPADQPKYTFTVLLEDGGESFNSAQTAREFIDWFVTSDSYKQP